VLHNRREPKFFHITLSLASDSLFSFLLDTNATLLANTILRRRDSVFSQVPTLSRDAVVDLRSYQPLVLHRHQVQEAEVLVIYPKRTG